jgi:hypothetical protein
MRITTALLCDHAQIREGLLFVHSGGITRLRRPDLPCALQLHLAVVARLESIELDKSHVVKVTVRHVETLAKVMEAEAAFQTNPTSRHPGEPVWLPLALPLTGQLQSWGEYDIALAPDGEAGETLSFWIEQG